MGATEADLANMAMLKRSNLQTGLDLRAPLFDEQERNAVRAVGDDHAARGVYGSGMRATKQNEAAQHVENLRQQDTITTQGSMNELDLTLAQQIAALRRDGADKTLEATQRVALGGARKLLDPLIGA